MSKIKRIKRKQGSKIRTLETPDYNRRPPVFSLEKLTSGDYCLSRLTDADKAKFADAIFKRKTLSWNEINKTHRQGLGCEKIYKNSIKAPIPRFITDDMEHFLAFRFSGQKAMIGYRLKDVFFVLWFDHNFSLYNHS